MQLKEHLASLPPEKLQKVMNKLSKHGDANGILQSIRQTEPCWQSDQKEVILTDRLLIEWNKAALFNKTSLSLIPVEGLVACIHCLDSGGFVAELKLLLADGREFWRPNANRKETYAVFTELKKRCVPFEELPGHPLVLAKANKPISGSVSNSTLHFRGVSLVEESSFLGKRKEKLLVGDIRDVLWAIQKRHDGGEDSDDHYMTLFLANGKDISVTCQSTADCFRLAVELKRRVPHMLYGPDTEYAKILERGRKELEAVLKGHAAPQAAPAFQRAPSMVESAPKVEAASDNEVQIPAVYGQYGPRLVFGRVCLRLQRGRSGSMVELVRAGNSYRLQATWTPGVGQSASRSILLSPAEAVWVEEQVYRVWQDSDFSVWQAPVGGYTQSVEIIENGRSAVSFHNKVPLRKYQDLQTLLSRLVQYGSSISNT